MVAGLAQDERTKSRTSSSSSTSRMVSLPRGTGRVGIGVSEARGAGSSRRGSDDGKRAPRPGALSTVMSPPDCVDDAVHDRQAEAGALADAPWW